MGLGIRELLNLPVWSALDIDDEGRILAGHDASGSIQLVELAADGTPTPLTALPGPCSGRYVPGRRAVIVQHDKDGNERKQLSLLRLDPPPTAPVGLDGLEPLVHDERYIHSLVAVEEQRIVYTTNRRNSVDFDVVLRSLDDGTETVAYQGGGWVDAVAMAVGRAEGVLNMGTARPMSDQLRAFSAELDGISELTDARERAQHRNPQWFPDGRRLIVNSDRGRNFVAVHVFEPETRTWTVLVQDDAHDVWGYLSPDGATLLCATNEDGAMGLTLHDAESGERLRAVELPEPGWTAVFPYGPISWSPDSSRIALSYTSPSTPCDVLRVDAASGEVTTVAGSTGPLAGVELVHPVLHLVPAHDGERIPCFVYQGTESADTALAGSAVLYIHGGPEGQSVRAFNPIVQGLAAAGHTVLVPNVRGSIGYGKRWYSLDDVRLRLDSVADMASVRAYLPALGADQSRAALMGGSYGGYMVLAGVAFQPELWAAGVDIVGMSSLVTFLENTSPYRRALREREYGALAHDRDFLEQASPLSRIDDIRAPLFVIHGANDPRVPLSEAEQLTAALTANGVACELVVYGDEGHGLSKRANRVDAYPRALEFLADRLRAGEEV